MFICIALAFIGGVFVTALRYKRQEPPTQTVSTGSELQVPAATQPAPETPKPEVPARLMPEPTKPTEFPPPKPTQPSVEQLTANREKLKKELALVSCRVFAQAMENYARSPQNPGETEVEKLPRSPQDLRRPPFGGSAFLKDDDIILDPWNGLIQIDLRMRKDGTQYVLVYTIAPDKTPICQFGIGEEAFPKKAAK